MAFQKKIRIYFRQVDAAGISFFSRVHEICHDVFEEFLESQKVEWKQWFSNPEHAAPIKKVTTEYMAPLRGGDQCVVHLEIPHLGEHSFTSRYEISRENVTCCIIEMVHVFIDPVAGRKIAVPPEMRSVLKT